MKIPRRRLLHAAALAAPALSAPKRGELREKFMRILKEPVLRREHFREAARVESVDLLRIGKTYVVRARSASGAVGYSEAHSSVMAAAYPILVKKVAPSFLGKDARDLDALLEAVYLAGSNYKWQGLPFWVAVAAVEIAILDMLGQISGKPLGELLGKVSKRKIAVYRASGNRGNSPEAEIAFLQKIVSETGAKAIKFRLGARMAYDDASTKRDYAMIPLTRKTFGDRMAIYADGNGSYDVPMAIKIGRIMEEHKLAFLEEPVPFDYYDETKAVADALQIPIALGEEEMSLRGFGRIIEHDIAQVVQPDLLYFGGLIRSMKVAKMAAAAGIDCTPHMSGGGLGYLYIAHFASCVPNCGAHQEYKGEEDTLPVSSDSSSLKSVGGMLDVPTGPGLGITIDPAFLAKGSVVSG